MNQSFAVHDSDHSAAHAAGRVRVLIIHDRDLLRDGLDLILRSDAHLEVCGAVARISDSSHELHPDVILVGYGSDGNVIADVANLQSGFPRAKVVLLDDVANDGRVLVALRTDARGYLTTRQPGAEVISAIRRAAVGERVFTPEIAARLTVTPEGMRLKRSDGEGPLTGLTPREREVMTYLSLGYTVKQTAATLGLRPSTVDNHKTRLMKKLNVHKTVELTRLAFRYGLVNSDGAGTPPPDGDSSAR
jgi:DNA-binding NarL/FixJ family response regulator